MDTIIVLRYQTRLKLNSSLFILSYCVERYLQDSVLAFVYAASAGYHSYQTRAVLSWQVTCLRVFRVSSSDVCQWPSALEQ